MVGDAGRWYCWLLVCDCLDYLVCIYGFADLGFYGCVALRVRILGCLGDAFCMLGLCVYCFGAGSTDTLAWGIDDCIYNRMLFEVKVVLLEPLLIE